MANASNVAHAGLQQLGALPNAVFQLLDQDHDGVISAEEFTALGALGAPAASATSASLGQLSGATQSGLASSTGVTQPTVSTTTASSTALPMLTALPAAAASPTLAPVAVAPSMLSAPTHGGHQALPPWWILSGVKPEGPDKDMGYFKLVTFSPAQQHQFGISESGDVVDQAKHAAALAALQTPKAIPFTAAMPSKLTGFAAAGLQFPSASSQQTSPTALVVTAAPSTAIGQVYAEQTTTLTSTFSGLVGAVHAEASAALRTTQSPIIAFKVGTGISTALSSSSLPAQVSTGLLNTSGMPWGSLNMSLDRSAQARSVGGEITDPDDIVLQSSSVSPAGWIGIIAIVVVVAAVLRRKLWKLAAAAEYRSQYMPVDNDGLNKVDCMDEEYGLDFADDVGEKRGAQWSKADTPGGAFWATSAAASAASSAKPLPDLLGNALEPQEVTSELEPSSHETPTFISDTFLEEEEDLFALSRISMK